jgi:ribosomal protein L32
MSENEDTDQYNVKGDAEFQGKKTIVKVNIDKDAIKKEIKDEIQQEEKIDENVQHFETLKQIAKEQAIEFSDQIDACQSPREVMEILEAARNEKKKTETHKAPHGKSMFLSPSNAEQYADSAEMLDKLYDTAYYSKTATPEERQEARKKIDKLFESLIEGRSWDQIKRSKDYDSLIKTNIESCPSCGKTLISGANCSCGYDPYSKKHRPKTWEKGL